MCTEQADTRIMINRHPIVSVEAPDARWEWSAASWNPAMGWHTPDT